MISLLILGLVVLGAALLASISVCWCMQMTYCSSLLYIVTDLKRMICICEDELLYLDMRFNVRKSAWLRFGIGYCGITITLSPPIMVNGHPLPIVPEVKYLVVVICVGRQFSSGRQFHVSLQLTRIKFYRAFNAQSYSPKLVARPPILWHYILYEFLFAYSSLWIRSCSSFQITVICYDVAGLGSCIKFSMLAALRILSWFLHILGFCLLTK